MDLGLTGKVVLVTGGSKGIGLACARAFLDEGATVAIASRDADNLARGAELLAPHGTVTTHAVDLKDPDAAVTMVDEVEARHGAVDVLVNSAGAARREVPAELDGAMWRAAMEAKYFTYVNAMSAVIHRMAARGGGAIVNVAGMGGKLATPTHLTGGAANAAIMLVTAGLGNAFAAQGVRVNGVNPGVTETDRLTQNIRTQAQLDGIGEDEARALIVRRTAMGRLARPEEIADVVLFLASERASYVNGALLSLDGATTPTVL
jgi:NAD(P)-dependent dehydrogenase (short-subunit alcohol dehydrogenase family)